MVIVLINFVAHIIQFQIPKKISFLVIFGPFGFAQIFFCHPSILSIFGPFGFAPIFSAILSGDAIH